MTTDANQNELPPPESLDGERMTVQSKLWLKRISSRSEMEHRELLAFMATQPQSRPCRLHPDCNLPIDERETDNASRHQVYAGHGYIAGYAPCPKCVENEQNRSLKSLGVPENLIHARFSNFNPDEETGSDHVAVVKEFCEKRTGFLILSGDYGTGKTHLAVAALRKLKSGWLVKQATLLRMLRSTYTDHKAANPIERAQNAWLLVLDDVGLSGGGKDELPMLHEILDYRHGNKLPTIITTNITFENLTDVLGPRMANRLRESTFRVLIFGGSSHRREARERYFDAPPTEPPLKNRQGCI